MAKYSRSICGPRPDGRCLIGILILPPGSVPCSWVLIKSIPRFSIRVKEMKKMSKSRNNAIFITDGPKEVRQIARAAYDPPIALASTFLVIRWTCGFGPWGRLWWDQGKMWAGGEARPWAQ